MMSDHDKHTEFLRHCICYDESVKREELVEGITRLQRDLRCVQRAAWLMALLTAVNLAVLGFPFILVDNFPYNMPQSVINFVCALGLGLLISLLAFLGLGMVYRWKLDQRREECRQLVTQLLESRLGKPAAAPSRGMRNNRAVGRDDRTVRADNEVNGSPAKIESAVRG